MELYLLSIEELRPEKIGELEQMRERALRVMDPHRREKAQHLKAGGARDLAIGAGLLLQLAARRTRGEQACFLSGKPFTGKPCVGETEDEDGVTGEKEPRIKQIFLSVSELLEALEERGEPVQIRYRHSEFGKPDFADETWHFNLSHSGKYVCCALAKEEIGVDIQWMRLMKDMRLAERFFADREKEALRACTDEEERQKLFYRLWVRKEAYAKLTGEGIVRSVKMDVDTPIQGVLYEEYSVAEEYCLAVCSYVN